MPVSLAAEMSVRDGLRGLLPASLVRQMPASRRRKHIRASLARGNFARIPRLIGRQDPFDTGTLFSTVGLLLTAGRDAEIADLAPLANEADTFESAIFRGLVEHASGRPELAREVLDATGSDETFDSYRRLCARAWSLFLRLPRLTAEKTTSISEPGPTVLQYWDTESVPADVATAMSGWSAFAGRDYRSMDAREARAFLLAEFGKTEVAAFDACPHPAIQSDLIRLAWLFRNGGLYMDADAAIRPGFLNIWHAMSGRTVLWFYTHTAEGHFTNGVLAAPAGSPLLQACLEETCRRILADPQCHVYALGGPGMLTDMVLEADRCGLLDDVAILTTEQVRRSVMTQIAAEYKSDHRSWHLWQRSKPWEQGN